jgi:hypothetical protein
MTLGRGLSSRSPSQSERRNTPNLPTLPTLPLVEKTLLHRGASFWGRVEPLRSTDKDIAPPQEPAGF